MEGKARGIGEGTPNSEGDTIILKPYRPPDLTKFFDRIRVDLRSDLADWESVRRDSLRLIDTNVFIYAFLRPRRNS